MYNHQADLCKIILDYERSKEQQINLKSNFGAFYRYVNKKLHSLSGGDILKNAAGNMVVDRQANASLLSVYFSSVLPKMMENVHRLAGRCRKMPALKIFLHQLVF